MHVEEQRPGPAGEPAPPEDEAPYQWVARETMPVTSWRVVDQVPLAPISEYHDVVVIDRGHAWAVGVERYPPSAPDSSSVPVMARWDGREWSRAVLPRPR